MAKKRIFVSFDFDNDKILKEFIIGQSRLPDSPFECVDFSLKEAAPQATWELAAEKKIRIADLVIVMLGCHTHRAPGVLKEVAIARRVGTPIIQIKGYKDPTECPQVANAGNYYRWNWDNLKKILAT